MSNIIGSGTSKLAAARRRLARERTALAAGAGKATARAFRHVFRPTVQHAAALRERAREKLLASRSGEEEAAGARAQRFGPYVLRRELGRGGSGIVYLAARPPRGREVALKILASPQFASRETRSRFRREARSAAALHHPNIVKVHEIGEEAGCPYFTMEAIAGPTLGDWLRETSAPLARAVAVMRKVCGAVGYAHAQGIVHRDLKPGNIVVDSREEPQIMDFGLAKSIAAADESFATVSGTVLGTPHYMSPEQAAGEVDLIDGRSDIYAIGVILFEIAAGDVPFRADSFTGLLQKIARADPPPLRERNENITPEFEALVANAMAKDPARRHANAFVLEEALARCPLERRVEPLRGGPLARARGFVERHRVAAAALFAGALALAGFAAPGRGGGGGDEGESGRAGAPR